MAIFGLTFGKKDDKEQPGSSAKADAGGDGAGKATGGGRKASGYKPNPTKARKFFEHGEVTSDARNFDYSIECYINGLKSDIANMKAHEALHEVARKRKVDGGKGPGMMAKAKPPSGPAWEKMLHYEMLWAKDPTDATLLLSAMQQAVAADGEVGDDTNLAEVAYWMGELALPIIRANKGGNASQFLKLRDLFREIGSYDKAVEACRFALNLKPNDTKLLGEFRELEAEAYSAKTTSTGEDGEEDEGVDFRKNIKDAEQQRILQISDSASQAEQQVVTLIEQRRGELEENPQDTDRVGKLVEALLRAPTLERETEAIDVLQRAFDETGQYRFKVRIGDIKMRQFARRVRELQDKLKQDAGNADLKSAFDHARREQLAFELGEYQDRVKNYPTDMGLRYELGRRLMLAGKVDDAIGAFQEAQADPKRRSHAMLLLGQCYLKKGWYDEAVDTLHKAIEQHKMPNDKLMLEMKYVLMDALTRHAKDDANLEKANEARKLCSEIIQADINFRDVKQRMEAIKALVDELKAKG